MATTRFYDIVFINKSDGREKAFHVEDAKNKGQAIGVCHKAIVRDYNQILEEALEDHDHVCMVIDGCKVTGLPVSFVMRETAQQWKVKKCIIHTIPGSYSKKRNADGSKKRKRDQKKATQTPKPQQDAAPVVNPFTGEPVEVKAA